MLSTKILEEVVCNLNYYCEHGKYIAFFEKLV